MSMTTTVAILVVASLGDAQQDCPFVLVPIIFKDLWSILTAFVDITSLASFCQKMAFNVLVNTSMRPS